MSARLVYIMICFNLWSTSLHREWNACMCKYKVLRVPLPMYAVHNIFSFFHYVGIHQQTQYACCTCMLCTIAALFLFCIGNETKEGDIRLVRGRHPWEGRVEIFLSGVWGTVCDDGARAIDASVVCRQLGYSTYSKLVNRYLLRHRSELYGIYWTTIWLSS